MKVPFRVKVMRKVQLLLNADRLVEGKMPDYGVKTVSDLNYFGDTDPNHTLDVYLPPEASGKLPVIVECHGGGYTTCCKEINRQHGQWFASNGYAVVNVNYTLMPEATLAEEMRELAQVYVWIEQNADEYGFDLNRLYLTGDSSGGHMVLLFGALQNRKDLQELLGVKPCVSPIKAVAATCPVGDLASNSYITVLLRWLLGKDAKVRNFYKEESFPYYLDEHMLPTLVLTAKTDMGIHGATMKIWKHFKRVNKQCHLISYKKQENILPHVFNVLNPDWPESVAANTDILDWFERHQ